MNPSESQLLAEARVGHLATLRPNGAPHVVPVTFAVLDGDVVSAVDHKPKRHNRLQRLLNIAADGRASLLVDHWDENWDRLWWVRVDGVASIHDRDIAAVRALVAKYRHYEEQPPSGPVIRLEPIVTTSWAAQPPLPS